MISFKDPYHRCDGVTRREALRAGVLTAFGVTLADWLRPGVRAAIPSSARRAILLWLDGGPSHLDTFDLKPEAPQEVRGPFRPIATQTPGIQISEYLPLTAKRMNRLAIIRSMTSPLGEHNLGSHYLLTGYKPTPALHYPSYGSVLAEVRGGKHALPPYIAIPEAVPSAQEGYLPRECRPFAVGGDPSRPDFRVRDLETYPEVTPRRLQRRNEFRLAFDRFHHPAEEREASREAGFDQAQRLLASNEARKAFDLTQEKSTVRARYGSRTLGQACLLARRLLEAGVPFVTVTDRGWDTHDNLVLRLKEGYTGGSVGKVPTLDQAFAALLDDLAERGMLETTLVLVMGEFGRTPKLNPGGGRDHWPRVFSAVLAGGGIKGGQVVGKSDRRGESPAERPITPEDLACTIYHTLGIQASHELHTRDGRPVPVNQQGRLIKELL